MATKLVNQVKLYELDQGAWTDQGIGFASFGFVEVFHSCSLTREQEQDSLCIIVKEETSGSVKFLSVISSDIQYSREDGIIIKA